MNTTITSFRLVSNNICFGPAPKPDQIIEQRLRVNNCGSVWLSHFVFGNGLKYPCVKLERFKMADTTKLFRLISDFIQENQYIMLWKDVGSWKLSIYGYNQGTMEGPLASEYKEISCHIRNILGRSDLFAMDGGE